MAEWTQRGFAIVTDSTLGPPLVIGFHLPRWEAEAEPDFSAQADAG